MIKVPGISIPRMKKPHQQDVLSNTPSDPSRDIESSQESTEQPKNQAPQPPTTTGHGQSMQQPKSRRSGNIGRHYSSIVSHQTIWGWCETNSSRRADETATSDKQAGNFPPHWSAAILPISIKNGIGHWRNLANLSSFWSPPPVTSNWSIRHSRASMPYCNTDPLVKIRTLSSHVDQHSLEIRESLVTMSTTLVAHMVHTWTRARSTLAATTGSEWDRWWSLVEARGCFYWLWLAS